LQAYQDLGGIKGALTKHAEDIYMQLPSDEHRRLARGLFIRLIDPGSTEQDTTRRRATLDEFVLADPLQTRLLQEIIQTFIAARLLVSNEIAGAVTIEVSHEALIRAWTRFSTWVQEAREDIPQQRAISQDAATWEHLNKPTDRLYRGSQLKAAKAWAKRNTPSKQETLFLRTSTAYLQRQAVSMLSIILFIIIISTSVTPLLIFLQPALCPTSLCPRPTPQILLQKNSTHDSNLEVSFHSIQSSWHTISDNPEKYTLANLPTNTHVQLIDNGLQQPYRVALGIHNLQRGRFGMLIEQVAIVIKKVNPLPYPLRAWFEGPKTTLTNNLYHGVYTGQEAGGEIPVTYVSPIKLAKVSLVPGESDEITLEIFSHQVADIQFQVKITYRIANESDEHTLTLSNVFELAFSDKANWHPYILEDGHLAASS